MKAAARNQNPQTKPASKFTRLFGRVAAKGERSAPQAIDWEAVAAVSEAVPPKKESDKSVTLWVGAGASEIASTTIASGHSRALQGILFVGGQRFGMVLERSAHNPIPEKFLLTTIGAGQRSGKVIHEVDINGPQESRPEGVIKSWEEVSIGRGFHNDVSIDNQYVSAQHAKLTVSAHRLEIVDENSTSGTHYFDSRQATPGMDPVLAHMYRTMNAQPELWSGEFMGAFMGATVLPQK